MIPPTHKISNHCFSFPPPYFLPLSSGLEKYKDNMREFYVMTLKQLQAAQYPIPSFLDKNVQLPEGWKETKPAKEPAKQKRLVALDCEMVISTSISIEEEDAHFLFRWWQRLAVLLLDIHLSMKV